MLDITFDPAVLNNFDPARAAPRFVAAVHDWFDPADHGTIRCLYMMIGAAIFGAAPTYAKAFWLTGTGQNGKSTLINIIKALIDPEKCKSIKPHMWGDPYHLADMAGARINCVAEVDSSELRHVTDANNLITGSDAITARWPYGRPFQYVATAAQVLACNALPIVKNHTFGWRRRQLVFPFDRTIPEAKKNLQLEQEIKEHELAGVFAVAAHGYRDLVRTRAYPESATMLAARRAWNTRDDHLEEFAEECLLRVPPTEFSDQCGKGTAPQRIYDAANCWLQNNGYSRTGANKIKAKLEELYGRDVWQRFHRDGRRFALEIIDRELEAEVNAQYVRRVKS